MYELSVGSKVFLFGEYQVLKSGKALLATLEPRFKLQIKPGTGNVNGIPEGSPAHRLIKQDSLFFKLWDLNFLDPHNGSGGFGASTAQFSLVHGFKESHQCLNTQAQVMIDFKKLHRDYLTEASLSSGIQPSGADLIAQVQGGLVEIDFKAGKVKRQLWPFSQKQVLFFSTGYKLPTHTHLSTLSEDSHFHDLEFSYDETLRHFEQNKFNLFIHSIQNYQNILDKKGWLSDSSRNLLCKINGLKGVIASKGCGAMGNDVIAVIVSNENQSSLIEGISRLGLKYSGNLEQTTEGFNAHWINQ